MHVSYTEPRDPCPSSREFSSFGIRMYISLLRICEISESWNEHRTSSGWPRFLIPVQIIGWFVIIDSSNRNHALPPGTRARSVSIACMSIPSLHQSRNPYLDSKRSRDARTRPASVPRSQFVLLSSRIFIVDNYLTIRQYCTGWWSMIGGEGDQEVGASSFLPSFFPSR